LILAFTRWPATVAAAVVVVAGEVAVAAEEVAVVAVVVGGKRLSTMISP
jgi:hypothetical protein